MSVRNRQVDNPVVKNIEYRAKASDKGPGGTFFAYDKATKKTTDIEGPITFVNIETYAAIVGWNDAKEAGIYSNEVLSTQIHPLTVRLNGGGTIAEGLYKDIKDSVKASGGKYCNVIYAIMNKEIVKITLKGAALSSFFSVKGGDIITVKEFTEAKKGATKYIVPVFESKALTDEQRDKLQDDYPALFAYLDDHDKNLGRVSAGDAQEQAFPSYEPDEMPDEIFAFNEQIKERNAISDEEMATLNDIDWGDIEPKF